MKNMSKLYKWLLLGLGVSHAAFAALPVAAAFVAPPGFAVTVSVREGWSVAGSTTDDAALARWCDGNRLTLSGNAGILLVLEGK